MIVIIALFQRNQKRRDEGKQAQRGHSTVQLFRHGSRGRAVCSEENDLFFTCTPLSLPPLPLMTVSFICLLVNLFSSYALGHPHAIIGDEVICFLSLFPHPRPLPDGLAIQHCRMEGLLLIKLLTKE